MSNRTYFKKTAAVMLAFAFMAASIGVPPTQTTESAAASKIKLSKTKLSLALGKSTTIQLKNVKKKDADKIKWTTSNKKVATVSPKNGSAKTTVKGVSIGKASIKAKLDKKTYTCKVSVVVADSSVNLEKAELPMYFRSVDQKESIKLYFADKAHEIPYIDADTVKALLEKIYHEINLDNGFSISLKTKGDTAVFTRENTYMMELDAAADKIYFKDYDAFFMPSSSPTIIDVLEHYGLINCLKVVEGSSYSRYGCEVTMDLAAYGIDLIEKDGVCYMPLQTFGDICTSLSSYAIFLYNGQAVFVDEFCSDFEGALYDKYFETKADTPNRSQKLIDFTYNELCMILDYSYGLKEQHNITTFDEYLYETGLKQDLLSEDTLTSAKALYDLTYLYIADMHSNYIENSWRIGPDANARTSKGKSFKDYSAYEKELTEYRDKYFPNGVAGYQEVGDTAYITFDEFGTMPAGTDYYKNPPTADTTDTVGICLYAFSQITRPGSPVKNVVLDLSINGGGDTTTGSFVLSMFLGEASVCLEDTMTGAYMNETFCCDANLDGVFDEKDSLKNYRLFCLTSPCSFSCGNLVPCVLKDSMRVKTIGMTSGGGACVVLPLSLADGTTIRVSGNRRLSYMKNGSVYDIDRGCQPDYPITTFERFYNRDALTKYIDGLY